MKTIRSKEDLETFIANRIDENSSLEYKAAEALGRSDGKKREITKDVSAFANSAGGTIVYGLAESSGSMPPRVPERIDPVDCREISKEWLDQIVGQIRPKISDIQITAIHVGPADTDFVYVVDVPQSATAHQALDHRYYSRRNFESTPMEDYEVRDVMHRAVLPSVEAELRIVADYPTDKRSHFAVTIKNTGSVMARHYAAVVRLPLRNRYGIIVPEGGTMRTGDGPAYWTVSFSNDGGTPLFPGSEVEYRTNFKHMTTMNPDPGTSIENAEIALYADNMAKIVLEKSFEEAHNKWT